MFLPGTNLPLFIVLPSQWILGGDCCLQLQERIMVRMSQPLWCSFSLLRVGLSIVMWPDPGSGTWGKVNQGTSEKMFFQWRVHQVNTFFLYFLPPSFPSSHPLHSLPSFFLSYGCGIASSWHLRSASLTLEKSGESLENRYNIEGFSVEVSWAAKHSFHTASCTWDDYFPVSVSYSVLFCYSSKHSFINLSATSAHQWYL